MAKVRTRERKWHREDDHQRYYKEKVEIHLNRNDYFEFKLPSHYEKLFNDTSYPEIEGVTFKYGKARFEVMRKFEEIYDKIFNHYFQMLMGFNTEKVLIIIMNYKRGNSKKPKIEIWNSSLTTSRLDFEYIRGSRDGKNLYATVNNDTWELSDSKYYMYDNEGIYTIIPYTKEREAFLIAFQEELNNMGEKISSFITGLDDENKLTAIDEGMKIKDFFLTEGE